MSFLGKIFSKNADKKKLEEAHQRRQQSIEEENAMNSFLSKTQLGQLIQAALQKDDSCSGAVASSQLSPSSPSLIPLSHIDDAQHRRGRLASVETAITEFFSSNEQVLLQASRGVAALDIPVRLVVLLLDRLDTALAGPVSFAVEFASHSCVSLHCVAQLCPASVGVMMASRLPHLIFQTLVIVTQRYESNVRALGGAEDTAAHLWETRDALSETWVANVQSIAAPELLLVATSALRLLSLIVGLEGRSMRASFVANAAPPANEFAKFIAKDTLITNQCVRLFQLMCRTMTSSATDGEIQLAIERCLSPLLAVLSVLYQLLDESAFDVESVVEGAGLNCAKFVSTSKFFHPEDPVSLAVLEQCNTSLLLLTRIAGKWPVRVSNAMSSCMFVENFTILLQRCQVIFEAPQRSEDEKEQYRACIDCMLQSVHPNPELRRHVETLTYPSIANVSDLPAVCSFFETVQELLYVASSVQRVEVPPRAPRGVQQPSSRSSMAETDWKARFSQLETSCVAAFLTGHQDDGKRPSAMHDFLMKHVLSLLPLSEARREEQKLSALNKLADAGLYGLTLHNSSLRAFRADVKLRYSILFVLHYLMCIVKRSNNESEVSAVFEAFFAGTADSSPRSAAPLAIEGSSALDLAEPAVTSSCAEIDEREREQAMLITCFCSLVLAAVQSNTETTIRSVIQACSIPTLVAAVNKMTRGFQETSLFWTICTLRSLVTHHEVQRYILTNEPMIVLCLLSMRDVVHHAQDILVSILTFDTENGDEYYFRCMSQLVVEIWDTISSLVGGDGDIFLALLEVIRVALQRISSSDNCLEAERRLQNVLCDIRLSPDCFVKLVHKVNAPWGNIPLSEISRHLLATIAALVRGNPFLRKLLWQSVGPQAFVDSFVLAVGRNVTLRLVQHLMTVVFETDEHCLANIDNAVIQNEGILPPLLSWFLEGSVRDNNIASLVFLLERLYHAFKMSRQSLWCCSSAGVFDPLAQLLPVAPPAAMEHLQNCLTALAAHHIDIRQLKRFLGLLMQEHCTLEKRRQLLPLVIETLNAACYSYIRHRRDPKQYVLFRTRSGACGIKATLSQPLPNDGYSLCMWLRSDSLGSSKGSAFAHKQIIFSMLNDAQSTIMELQLVNSELLLLSRRRANGGALTALLSETALNYSVPSQSWIHLCVTHKPASLMSKAIFSLAINGEEVSSLAKIEYPVMGAGDIFFGTNRLSVKGGGSSVFYGQMNAIYVFSTALTTKEIAEIYQLGGNHSSCFLPHEKFSVNPRYHSLFDGKLSQKVVVCIDPRLSEHGNLYNLANVLKPQSQTLVGTVSAVLDSTNNNSANYVEALEGTANCITNSIIDTMCSLGALQCVIVPFSALLVNPQLPFSAKGLTKSPFEVLTANDDTPLRNILKLLESLLAVDIVRAEVLSMGVFAILAHLLERLAPRLSDEIPMRLANLCAALLSRGRLFDTAFSTLFLSSPILSGCSFETQKAFIETLRRLAGQEEVNTRMRGLGLHRFVADLLTRDFCEETVEHAALRDLLFRLLDVTVREPIAASDAAACITALSFASTTPSEAVCLELLKGTRGLLTSRPRVLIEHLGKQDVIYILVLLLRHSNPRVRCETVRIIAAVVSVSRHTQELLNPRLVGESIISWNAGTDAVEHSPQDVSLSFIAEYLRIFPFTQELYVSLREGVAVSPDPPSLNSLHSLAIRPTAKLRLPNMLIPILQLVREAGSAQRRLVLSDLNVLLSNDAHAWSLLMSQSGWYVHLVEVMMADEGPASQAPSQAVESPTTPPVSAEGQAVLLEGCQVLSNVLFRAIQNSPFAALELQMTIEYLNCQHYSTSSVAATVLLGTVQRLTDSFGQGTGKVPSNTELTNIFELACSIEDHIFYSRAVHVAGKKMSISADGFAKVDRRLVYREDDELHFVSHSIPRGESDEVFSDVQSSPANSPTISAESPQVPLAGNDKSWHSMELALQLMNLLCSNVLFANHHGASVAAPAQDTFGDLGQPGPAVPSSPSSAAASQTAGRRGGLQRIFLRLLRVACDFASESPEELEVILRSVRRFQEMLEKESTSVFFRRKVSDDAEGTPLRAAMYVYACLEQLLVRRLKAADWGLQGRRKYFNIQILERMKYVVSNYSMALHDIHAFVEEGPLSASFLNPFTLTASSRHSASAAGQSPGTVEKEPLVKEKTTHWLKSGNGSDLDEFTEISLRGDYRSFSARCKKVVDTSQELDRRLADGIVAARQQLRAKVHNVVASLSVERRIILDSIEQSTHLVHAQENPSPDMRAVNSSVFQTSWYRFVVASKDSIWNTENAGGSSAAKVKYWRLLRTQQGLMRRLKTVRDPDGTDYRAITSKAFSCDDDAVSPVAKRQQQSRLRLTHVRQQSEQPHSSDDESDEKTNSRASTAVLEDPSTQDEQESSESPSVKDAADKLLLSVPCEVCHIMHCWSAKLSIVGSQLTAVIDEVNTAYNQVVAKDAGQYLQRPRNVSWNVADIVSIAPHRRFRMQRTAIELLFRDNSSLLVNFDSNDTHDSCMLAITKALPPRRQAGKNYPYLWEESPRKELAKRRATERWKNREISNFDYLLELNFLAGRTVNDFTQYPVFPWVIADYTSPELNLQAPETFRDLRLPIGLCGLGNRREEVETRYTEMLQMGDEPFHYFTHYSSPAVVLYFMVRIEPFTCCQVLLQGGRFDHADRMFHSVASSWLGVTKNIQDVKEMIPEIYYFPELCINNNNIRFGRKQDQTEMLDVVLPSWAKDDPFTFTYRMREALECDYVSSLLNHWIDLIFGFKQTGKAAVQALNKFHPHTYEDPKVKLSALDEATRKEVIDSLDNIGQTPIQLFTKKHPERKKDDTLHPILSRSIGVKIVNASWAVERVATVRLLRDKLVVIGGYGAAYIFKLISAPVMSRKEISTPTSTTKIIDNIKNFRASTFSFDVPSDPEGRLPALPNGIIPNENLYENGPCSWKDVAILSYEGDSVVYTVHGGYYDNSVYVRSFRNDDLRLTAHRGRVTCLASATDSSYLVTGGKDTAFIVWSTAFFKGKLHVEISSTIYGHEEGPTACALSTEVDMVVTASSDGVVLLHSLSSGRLEQCILHPQKKQVDFILIQHGCYVPNILMCSKGDNIVHQYSINGTHLRLYNVVGRLQHLACVAADPQYVLMTTQQTSSQESTVQFLHSFFLTPVYKLVSSSLPLLSVVACHPTNVQIIVAGGVQGSLVLLGTDASAGVPDDRTQGRFVSD
jgi:WD40 repeat protein